MNISSIQVRSWNLNKPTKSKLKKNQTLIPY